MTTKLVVFALLVATVVAERPPYRPSGWRPAGQTFNPATSGSYGAPPRRPPPSNGYGTPISSVSSGGEPSIPSTPRPETTTEPPTTTTPKTREPTTPTATEEDDFATGPALAVANSFAFNRPIYVYNGYPFYSAGYTLLK